MTDIRLKLSPPWITAIHKFQALFDGDPQIACNVKTDSGKEPILALACNNGDKVAALLQILPTEIIFGNIPLHILVDGLPSNRAFKTKKELFETAFSGNPAFAYAVCPVEEGATWFDMTYVVFKNCVVQFFNDNLNDCHGVISTLYEDIARDILTGEAVQGVYFNTDVERGKIGMPLGEWP